MTNSPSAAKLHSRTNQYHHFEREGKSGLGAEHTTMGVTPNAPRHIAGGLDSSGPLMSKTRRHRDHRPPQAGNVPERELSLMSKKIEHFDKYSRKNGQWSWKRPSYERSFVSLVKAERKMEEGIANALTEVDAIEAGLRYFDEFILPSDESRRPKSPADECTKGGLASSEQENNKSNRTPKLSKHVPGKSLSCSGLGRAKKAGKGVNEAVARCGDLKLTLRQRLENYDRQRGINIQPSDQGASDTPALALNNSPAECNSDGNPEGLPRKDAEKCKSTREIPPPCEGGLVDDDRVQGILVRSLGKAVMAVRRAARVKRSLGGVSAGSSGEIPKRFRWRSWQGTPPFALASTGVMGQKASPRAPHKGGGVSARLQAREKRVSGSCPSNGGSLDLPGEAEESAPAVQTSDVADSTTNGSSSTAKASRKGATPVPRVARLAAEINARKKSASDTTVVRRTKDFDPDKLECVRRHEASVTERARKQQNLKAEVARKSLFRARPLPPFLRGVHDGAIGLEGGSLPRDDTAGGVDMVGTKQDLLTALTQDKEARELVDKIKKINPHADIASIILSSTPGPKAVRASVDRRGPIFSGVTPQTETLNECFGCDFNASKMAIGGQVDDHSKPDTLCNEHHQQNDEPTRPLPLDGDNMDLALGEQKRAVNSPVETGRGWQAASRRAITDDAEGERRVDGTPRSLMGKMLGSGMLERQTEWSKERRRKVMESRRKADEVKEREAKSNKLEAGFGERSWSNAKIEHLRSLEKQKAEEELREQFRKASIRASAVRAQRERGAAEEKTATLAADVADAGSAAKKSRAVTFSKGEAPRKPRPRRRPTSQVDDDAAAACVTGNRRERRRRRRGTQPDNESSNAPPLDRHSEDEFYRVAVKKILEEDGKAASAGMATEVGRSDRDGHALSTISSPRLEKPGSKEDGARDSSRLRDQTGHTSSRGLGGHGPNLQGGKCSTYASHSCSRRDKVERQVRRRRGPDVRRAKIRRSDRPALARPKAREDNYSRKLSPSDGPRRVGYSDSLLSLFEAQSVEHYTDDSDCVGGTDGMGRESFEGRSAQKDAFAAHSSVRDETCSIERQQQKPVWETRDIVLSEFPWSEEKAAWSQNRGMDPGSYPKPPEIGKCELKAGPAGVESPREVAESSSWARRQRLAETKMPRRTETAGQEDDAENDDDIFCGNPSRSTQGESKPQHAIILQQPRTSSHAITLDEGSWDEGLSTEKKEETNREDFPDSLSCEIGYPLESGTITNQSDKRPGDRRPNTDLIVRHEERCHGLSRAAPYFTVHQENPDSDAATGIAVTSTQSRQTSRHNVATSKPTANVGGLDYIKKGERGQISGIGQGVRAGESVVPGSPRSMCHVDSIIEEGDVILSSFRGLGQPFFDPVTSSADKGRFKVRDPRHFDPSSMRRAQDIVVKSNATGSPWGASDGRNATEGVTLLKGRRVTEDGGDRRTLDREEKVITVMFDRAKFNEQEAQRWWALNCTRVEGDPQ